MSIFAFYQGFNEDGKKVFESVCTHDEWYEEPHPVIDDDAERVRLAIVTIKGTYFHEDRSVRSRWENRYNGAGAIVEAAEMNAAGKVLSRVSFEYGAGGELTGQTVRHDLDATEPAAPPDVPTSAGEPLTEPLL